MPYTGPSDASLPAYVKKLSASKRKQWVAIFNRTMQGCEGSDCESRAFRYANGVVMKKETYPVQCECKEWSELPFGTKEHTCLSCQRGMKLDWSPVEEDEKCDQPSIAYYKPYGGATSFDQIDAYRQASDAASNISMMKYAFDAIYENIQSDMDMSADQKVAAVENASKEMIKRMQMPSKHSESMKEKIRGFLFGDKVAKVENPPLLEVPTSCFLVTKDIQGDWRWLALFSNKFEDREGEIFSEDAHKEYEAWVDQTKNYPELRMWHVPGTDVGMADLVTYADGFQIAAGSFYKETKEVAESLAKTKGLAVSHGYEYRNDDLGSDGVYQRYRTFEISVLPGERAANPWTAFTLEQLQQEVAMGLAKEKRDFLVEHFGEERVGKLEGILPQLSKDLEEAGIGWKDLAEVMTDPVTDEKPAEEETPAATTEDPKPAATPEAAASEAEVVAKAIGDAVKEALAPVGQQISELQAAVKDLQLSDDEKIAAIRSPRTTLGNGASRPSESDATKIKGDTKGLEPDPLDEDSRQDNSSTAKARELVDTLLLGKK